MPKTVEEGFRELLGKLTPSATETEAAARHRRSIKSCLERAFGITHFFRTGSFGNGTSISRYSDVDYFAVIPSERLKDNSAASLAEVRNALDACFPRTGVRVNCPAVKVPFGTQEEETTEVVPARFVGTSGVYRVYEIPDCDGGWTRSSPEAHHGYVTSVDDKLGYKVKPLVRFIKAWKYFNDVPISSFYLELRVTKYADGETSIVYPFDVRGFLAFLDQVDLAKMQDPQGISGYIRACSTEAKLEEARSKLKTALSRANKAVSAQTGGDTEEAYYWWNMVFNRQFPRYEA
ncbi:nucleotidyltransferase [Carboxydochorda subterranea]|uniref:Nucleotidyltransferase n=1 Tax=Carboxydichorda subterranea TaxID=3109565 RepID=A0ABZ1C1D4_9FIRM|nr:nucleotidyltransferase [Limnochorda sp. L945t]WRP18818.1 nucleotidyltransferase [Limnochorda sp. L945t]